MPFTLKHAFSGCNALLLGMYQPYEAPVPDLTKAGMPRTKTVAGSFSSEHFTVAASRVLDLTGSE